jgi:hypothetical protein
LLKKLASLKTLTNFNNCSVSRIRFLFRQSLALIGQFSRLYIPVQLSELFSESQAAYGTSFRVTGGYQEAKLPEEGYCKGFHKK